MTKTELQRSTREMKAKYKHTNLIARDWRALARFYQDVFGCVMVPPERDLSGEWLDRGTGVKNARFAGAHLRLPGHGAEGPTLEIYQYSHNESKPSAAANREGIMHLAFEVNDVEEATAEVLRMGGSKLGDVTSAEVEGVGLLTFVYLTDPEGNIIELQSWR
jgi:catechol 2,3-dioxygenase-like lactoylglutathione lyase family enzyme